FCQRWRFAPGLSGPALPSASPLSACRRYRHWHCGHLWRLRLPCCADPLDCHRTAAALVEQIGRPSGWTVAECSAAELPAGPAAPVVLGRRFDSVIDPASSRLDSVDSPAGSALGAARLASAAPSSLP